MSKIKYKQEVIDLFNTEKKRFIDTHDELISLMEAGSESDYEWMIDELSCDFDNFIKYYNIEDLQELTQDIQTDIDYIIMTNTPLAHEEEPYGDTYAQV
jgi:hypothetical protein